MMKHVLAVLALFPAATFAAGANPAHAASPTAAPEVEAGTIEIGGSTNLGFRSGSEKESTPGGSATTDVTTWSLDGTGLYYVNPNFSVGGRLAYDRRTEDDGGGDFTRSTLFIGPAVAFEQGVAPKLAVFGLASVGLARSSREQGSVSVSGSGPGFQLEVGAKYFVVKNVSFNAALGYEWLRTSFDVGGVTTKNTDSGIGLNVGLSFYLPTK